MKPNPYSPPATQPQRRPVSFPLRAIGCVLVTLSIVATVICHWVADVLITVVHSDSSILPPANPNSGSAEFVYFVIQPNWLLLIPLLLSMVVGIILAAPDGAKRPRTN